MSTTPPILDFRDPSSLTSALSSITLIGGGINNSVPNGTTSNPVTLRLYNNHINTSGVADATNCTFAAYDDASTQGSQSLTPTIQAWLQVQVIDYNGIVTNADSQYYAIGGTVKHRVPVNSGTLSGSGANYVTFKLQVVVPANAIGANNTQGLWLESNYNL